jgi:predicted NUDIX family phosphoesterase
MEEQVLVVERSVVESVGMFHGLTFDVEKYLNQLFAPGVPRFMPRSMAEKDPRFKQLIPYVLISCNGRYLSYVRGKRAGETRLVAKRSMGIGGHINPVDNEVPLFGADYHEIYNTAVQREVIEEIKIDSPYTDRVAALLNDDTNEVGQVHLGVVHHWNLETENVTRREQMITQLEFMDIAALQKLRDTMETWSQLCLDGLTEIEKS